jgi:adenylate kinase
MRQQAVLLIGPTGAGKSPLGEWLQAHGLWSRPCHHFDFGACLRRITGGAAAGFSAEEIRYLQDVVGSGALLEDETFYLAIRILEDYLRRRAVRADDLLVMNGLPRHLGQADALARHLEFLAVFHLRCDAETVWERLQLNTGGDRALRADDTLEMVARKLALFSRRTEPLLDHYRSLGVPVIAVPVHAHSQPLDLLPWLGPC